MCYCLKDGGEIISVDRGKGVTIWDLNWNYLRFVSLFIFTNTSSYKMEMLGVCDWSERLSFYQLTGKQVSQMVSFLKVIRASF